MPSLTDAAPVSIIAIGNPGSGKSTVLNYLAQKVMFNSGLSYGTGMTDVLDLKEVTLEMENGQIVNIIFCDTPGLNDAGKREAAGKAISTALKKGGATKILFFVTLESGRAKNDDVTTMNLVLKAAPEIGNRYGIIVNKIKEKQAKDLKIHEFWAQLLAGIFAGEKSKKPCAAANVQGVLLNEGADDEKDYLVPKGKLVTLEGSKSISKRGVLKIY